MKIVQIIIERYSMQTENGGRYDHYMASAKKHISGMPLGLACTLDGVRIDFKSSWKLQYGEDIEVKDITI
jgi:hypothetical protein